MSRGRSTDPATTLRATACAFSASAALSTLAALGPSPAAGQQADRRGGALPSARIVRTDTPPAIDGRLDDAAWSAAAVITDFHQIRPTDGAAPSEHTTVYLLYDDDALYVGVRLRDSEPSRISANSLRQRTPLRDDDRVALVIDPFNDRRSGYLFELNPNGVRMDGLYQNVSDAQRNWNGIWRGEASIDEQGWSAEFAIPFKTLSFDPSSDTWGFNVSRAIRRRGEEVVWVSHNRSYDPSIVGLLTGFSGINQGLGLDIVPSGSAVRSRDFAGGARGSDLDASLDVFYKITPSLNAALTINTDFSAAEVDDRQVNLTRFNLFFPERRGFFLQDTDIFEFGNIGGTSGNSAMDNASEENGRPFFSRRIGLADTGEPIDLRYGGKISGRVGRWSIGTLAVGQDDFDDLDGQNVFVGRATANVLDESTLGMIVTDGDPSSPLHNAVYGVDFRYLNTRLPHGHTIEGEAWYQRSETQGVRGRDAAYGLGLRIPNNEGFSGGAGIRRVEENFNPALGFTSRTGVEHRLANLRYDAFRGGGYLQQLSTGVDVHRVERLGGGLQSQRVFVGPLELESRARDQFRLRYIAITEAPAEPFRIYQDPTREVVIPAGRYSFERYGFNLETGSQRKLSGGFTFRAGSFYDGTRLRLNPSLSWKPSPHFALDLEYDWNDISLPQGDFTTRLIGLTTSVSFSSRLSWVTLVQYDNLSEILGIHSRLHWIPQDGREAFVVLNHNLQDFDRTNSFSSLSSDLTLKYSYTFRF